MTSSSAFGSSELASINREIGDYLSSEMSSLKCYNCDWEGKEEDLVEKQGSLLFYDYVASNTMMLDVTRTDHHCPSCQATLKSHRVVGGMVLDQ